MISTRHSQDLYFIRAHYGDHPYRTTVDSRIFRHAYTDLRHPRAAAEPHS